MQQEHGPISRGMKQRLVELSALVSIMPQESQTEARPLLDDLFADCERVQGLEAMPFVVALVAKIATENKEITRLQGLVDACTEYASAANGMLEVGDSRTCAKVMLDAQARIYPALLRALFVKVLVASATIAAPTYP